MSEKKVFITSDNKATFQCPKCEKATIADVSKYKNIEKSVRLKVRCACGHSYSVILERRKAFRKNVNLPGVYMLGKKKPRLPIIVRDLSANGLKFERKDKTLLKEGDTVTVEFTLDNRQKSVITKDLIIKVISETGIGAEFVSMHIADESTTALNFYLFN